MQIHVCNVSIQTDLGKMSVVMSLRRVVIENLTSNFGGNQWQADTVHSVG